MPDCYKCKHRSNISRSTHSSCHHPKVDIRTKSDLKTPLIQLLSMLQIGELVPDFASILNIEANPHGVRNGWFSWPFNFDPRWLKACDGFEAIDE